MASWLDGVNNSLATFFTGPSARSPKRRKTPERVIEPPQGELLPALLEWFHESMQGAATASTGFAAQKCVEKFAESDARMTAQDERMEDASIEVTNLEDR